MLGTLRSRSRPGLQELLESAEATICKGQRAPLELITKHLVVGTDLGAIPSTCPRTPLQENVETIAKKLRLKMSAIDVKLSLDLRKDLDRQRSVFLWQLQLLEIDWGILTDNSSSKGTFREEWTLKWQPEFTLSLVDASRYGNNLTDTATGLLTHKIATCNLMDLCNLLQPTRFSAISNILDKLLDAIEQRSAITASLMELLEVFPAIAQDARYGDVRELDIAKTLQVLSSFTRRITSGLVSLVVQLDEDTARQLCKLLPLVRNSLRSLPQLQADLELFNNTLLELANQELNQRINGLAVAMLMDSGIITPEKAIERLGWALSPGAESEKSVAWLDGFIEVVSFTLLHTTQLLEQISLWVTGLSQDEFTNILPLLRRCFSRFEASERRNLLLSLTKLPLKQTIPDKTQSANDSNFYNQLHPQRRELLKNTLKTILQ